MLSVLFSSLLLNVKLFNAESIVSYGDIYIGRFFQFDYVLFSFAWHKINSFQRCIDVIGRFERHAVFFLFFLCFLLLVWVVHVDYVTYTRNNQIR